ncbi:MAG: alpha/beta hydrolase [Leucobacter sp.]
MTSATIDATAARPEAHAEPTRLTVPTLGIGTRAWEYGDPDGAPMILVHGFRGDHHGLEGIADGLAESLPGVRAIAPDLPGFGETPAIPGRTHDLQLYGEWLRAFAAEVAPDGFAVLGHSFGTLVVSAAIAGGMAPSRLILVNPISAPALEGPQAALTQLAIAYYRAAELLPERAARRLLGDPAIVRVMSEVMAKTGDPELRSWIHAQHAAYFSGFSDASTLLQAFRASVSHTVPEFARAFTMPTLLIAGERDDITPLDKQLALRHLVPGSRLRIIPGTGHLVHYEAVPDAVAFVGEFVRDLARADRDRAGSAGSVQGSAAPADTAPASTAPMSGRSA